MVKVMRSKIHGKGVFSNETVKKGDEISCDVLTFNKHADLLSNYHYPWGADESCICVGFGSFFNHSNKPNFKIKRIDKLNKIKYFVALCNIEKDMELTMFYNNKFENSLK